MHIDQELTKKIAKTARLELTAQELETFTKDLKEILKAFSVLDQIDVKNTDSSFRPIEQKNSLREDQPTDSLTQEEALQFTKNKRDGFFIGPKTIE
jgi:aspartyl-tRNA(Asn)/glutamyl-tRNA(Gln) amidotransferase subunit C